MIHRAIGVCIGGLITFILLVIMVPPDPTWHAYVAPVVIGAVVAFFWPIVIVFWLARRAKHRREGEVDREVQRQLDERDRSG